LHVGILGVEIYIKYENMKEKRTEAERERVEAYNRLHLFYLIYTYNDYIGLYK
jgi:hypothetical protein